MYVHVAWTVRDRAPLIDVRLAEFLCRFLRDVARQERAHILEVGLVSTHIHLLVRLHPTTTIPRLMQRLKGGSSVIAGREYRSSDGHELKWERGYSIHTVGAKSLEAVRKYLRSQHLHHPAEAIPGWEGDRPHADPSEEWIGPARQFTDRRRAAT